MTRHPPRSTLFPYTPLSRSADDEPPADAGPDKTKDGRPIFKTSHYNKIPVKERGAIRILKVHPGAPEQTEVQCELIDRKSTRLNSSHSQISYAVFCLKKKKT